MIHLRDPIMSMMSNDMNMSVRFSKFSLSLNISEASVQIISIFS